MSGFKRRTPYRKNVEKEVLEALPEPEEGQHIVQVVQSHGSNIFLVAMQDDARTQTLARLPTRFRNLIWVKRGTFLLCSSSEAEYLTASGDAGRVTLNVEYVLFERQVKHLKSIGKWPDVWKDAFAGSNEYASDQVAIAAEAGGVEATATGTGEGGDRGKGLDNGLRHVEDEELFVNKNHQNRAGDDSSGTDLSSDEDDD